jgi:DNA-binding Xre family transcriptional regulator
MRRKGLVRLKLRQILQERGITGYAFAKYSGLSMNTIYRLTRPNGRFELIQADTMERICAALRITPTELFAYKV